MEKSQSWLGANFLEVTLLSLEVFSVIILIIFLTIYWYKCDKSNFSRCFKTFQVLIIIYISSHILIHLDESIKIQAIIPRFIKNLSFLYAQFTFFILCPLYSTPVKKLNQGILYIYIFPIIYTILTCTNQWHGLMGKEVLFYTESGFLNCDFVKSNFCLVIDYTVLMLIISYGIWLLLNLFRQRGRILKQGVLLLAMIATPLLLYGYDNTTHNILPFDFDPAPIVIAFITIFFDITVIRFRLFDILPIAFSDIVDTVKSAIIILDEENKIIYSNSLFEAFFSKTFKFKPYEKIDTFLGLLKDFAVKGEEVELIKKNINCPKDVIEPSELNVKIPVRKSFVINIEPIKAFGSKKLGKVISFNDVTIYKDLLEELIISNKKLKEYSSAVEDLAVTNERNRIARDIHDSISYELTSIINMLDICMLDFNNGRNDEGRQKLKLASSSSRKCLIDLRNSIYCLTKTGFENTEKSIKLINSLVLNFRRLGANIDFTASGDYFMDNPQIWETIFRICQEAMTNAIRHGKAENISIIIKSCKENIKLYIIDDGKGCTAINKGIGLSGMEQRVEGVNGTLVYGSGDDGGFYINISIPYSS